MSTPDQTHWQEILPGVWRANLGAHDKPTLTEAAEAEPKKAGIAKMPAAQLPFALSEITLHKTRDFATAELPLQPKEKIYGLGLQMSGLDRRGGVYHLRVDHYAEGHDRLHAPTPLYVSSLGYAVFFNTSRPINVYVGVGNRRDDPHRPQFRDRATDPKWDAQPDSGHVEASVQGPGLEVIVFAGPNPIDALARYNLFCGGGAMPPEWALGFWHRTPLAATADQVIDEVEEFRKRGFPLDVLGLEPGWQSRSYPGSMEFSPVRFPDPAAFLRNLRSRYVHVNLWENPYVAPGTDLHESIQTRGSGVRSTPENINPASRATQSRGELGFASHTVWLGDVPDVYDKSTARAIQEFQTKHHLKLGVSGYKIDEVDGFDNWLWPDHAEFPSGLDGLQMRQIYGVLWQRLLDEMYRKQGQRTFGLVRGSNGGASRFPFAIYSDTYDFDQYVTALVNCSLAGVLWCAEIRSASTDEEWLARMQAACVSPIAQLNAWDSGKKPWSYPAVEGKVREAMLLRESLVPYLYTTFAQYADSGIPPVRPMCLVDGGQETDQYMLGDSLLCAPIEPGKQSRKVRLPKGNWYDYHTGALVGDGETVTIEQKGDIPLLVKGGSIIPTLPGTTHVSDRSPDRPFVCRIYGSAPFHGELYEDDSWTLNYEKGEFGLFDLTLDGQIVKAAHRAGEQSQPTRHLKLP